MKPSQLLPLTGALLSAVLSTSAAPNADAPASTVVTPAPKKEVKLIDFTDIRQDPDGKVVLKPYQYAFSDWDRHVIDLPGRGVLIQAKSGNGGLGENNPQADFREASELGFYFSIGNANQAQSMSLGVTDEDGTEYVWNIRLARRPQGQPLRLRLHVDKPDSQTPGKKPGLDLARIASWQIRGDWQGRSIEVLLIRLTAEK